MDAVNIADSPELIVVKLRIMGESQKTPIERSPLINTGPQNTGRQDSPIFSDNAYDCFSESKDLEPSYDVTSMTVGSQKAVHEFQQYLSQQQEAPSLPSDLFSSLNEDVATSLEVQEGSAYKWVNNIKNCFWGPKEDFEYEASQLANQFREQGFLKQRLEILKNIDNPSKALLMEGIALETQFQKQVEAADKGLHDFQVLLKCIAESPNDLSKIVAKLNQECLGLPKGGLGKFTYFTTQIACTLFAYRALHMAGQTAKEIAYWLGASEAALAGSATVVEAAAATSSSVAPAAAGVGGGHSHLF